MPLLNSVVLKIGFSQPFQHFLSERQSGTSVGDSAFEIAPRSRVTLATGVDDAGKQGYDPRTDRVLGAGARAQ